MLNPILLASPNLLFVKFGCVFVPGVSKGTTKAPPSLFLATYSVPCPMNEVDLPPSNETPYPDCGPLIHPPNAAEGLSPLFVNNIFFIDSFMLLQKLPSDLSSRGILVSVFIWILTFSPKLKSTAPVRLPSLSRVTFPLSPKVTLALSTPAYSSDPSSFGSALPPVPSSFIYS